jgi:hypothetical protein
MVAMSFVVVGSALADDRNPPPWDRAADGTTHGIWEFYTSDPNPLPDVADYPYGDPGMSVYPGIGQEWWDVWGGRDGVWPLSGTIEIEIPNRPEPLPDKFIWVQVTWAEQAPGTFPIVTETLTGAGAELVDEVILEPTNEPDPAGQNWKHSTYLIHLQPNPDFEIVKIDGAVMVDEVVVDTICIPEPATVVMLLTAAMAAAGICIRRRR